MQIVAEIHTQALFVYLGRGVGGGGGGGENFSLPYKKFYQSHVGSTSVLSDRQHLVR